MDKAFINAIITAFDDNKENFEDNNLPPVAHIDKYRGQPLNPEAFEAYGLPAVFYELRCEWTKAGRLYQGLITATFHVQQDETWEISNIATNRDEGLKQIDLLNAVRFILDDLRSTNTGKMTRVSDVPVDTGVTTYDQLIYTCTYTPPQVIMNKFEEVVTPDLKVEGALKEPG